MLPTLFTCILFAIALSYIGLLQMRVAIIAGVFIVCLPLCGANGLMYQFMVLPLLAYETFLHFRSREPGASRKVGTVLLSAIVITFNCNSLFCSIRASLLESPQSKHKSNIGYQCKVFII